MRRSAHSLYATLLVLGLTLVAPIGPAHAGASKDSRRQEVIDAVRARYIHGVTLEIAQEKVGPDRVDVLVDLLAEPEFDARDNVVAFLHHLGTDTSIDALLTHLHEPVGDPYAPANDRALLLAPQTLGGIAGRGHTRALTALLDMTAERSEGGILARSATRSAQPSGTLDDLIEMAMRGLAYSQDSTALKRLQQLRDGTVSPSSRLRMDGPAETAIELYDELAAGVTLQSNSETPSLLSGGDADPANWFREYNFRFANHTSVTNPMTLSRADDLATHATANLGTSSYPGDMACCIRAVRNSSAGTFGATNGIINNASQRNSVWNAGPERFKVVRIINYCDGPGLNLVGCARINGNGIAVVRLDNLHAEAMLWSHELGHNVGLSHNNSDSRLVMFPELSADPALNVGLTDNNCSKFHSAGKKAEPCNGVGCF